MPGANAVAAQMVAQRGMQGPGPPETAVDPAAVEKGRNLIYELTDLLTTDPNLMLALKDDLIGFGQTIKQFAGGGQQQGPPGMGAGASPQGPPMPGPPGMGGMPGGGMQGPTPPPGL